MRDILTKLWKATDLQAEDDYNNRTNIQCLNMLGSITGSKELTTWFYLLALVAGSCSWTSTSVL